MNKAITKAAVFGMAALMLAGCMPTAHKVDVLYNPLAVYRGGSGQITLVTEVAHQEQRASSPSIRWVLGQITDSDGAVRGDVISDYPPQSVIADAMKRELSAAGYRVDQTATRQDRQGRVVVLTAVTVALNEVASLAKLQASCNLVVKVELWNDGQVIKRSEYHSKLSDMAIKDRDVLPQQLFQGALAEIMQQAVPDIIRQFN
ncbi:hypothetical protein FO488_15485 [Geobacter sp. FeAm09]|uniref:hypothetical protein n=1 Tax=Geobacter sp. FeAm09 TaxID=2597769 RepID=UPI0011EC0C5D|nr:hypothetical protein [Geobacter sp. FeAm09]QEM69416.1 hypothetical protein FO488_15485 [Geobacter sp. FeAm09]